MNKTIAEKIIALMRADLTLRDKLIQERTMGDGYHEEMKKLHDENAKVLSNIIDSIGFPTISKVGKEASEAAWLVIQHSIGQPDFMRKCRKLLETAVEQNEADPKNLAYLTDRIAVLEGKPQLYGTQFDWDEQAQMSPQPMDNITRVNERRKSIGLNSLDEQTLIIRKRMANENQTPPSDIQERRLQADAWRKSVGWIN